MLVLSISVMSDSVIPWAGALQILMFMGILQVRKLEWVAMSSFRGLPNPGIKLRSLAL